MVQSTDVGRAWDFHEIRPASSSPRSFHFPLDGIIVVDPKPFKETSSMRVCPSMRSFECLFVHLLLSPVAFCRHHGNKTKRLLWNLHQRCQFLFLFDAFKPTETVFLKTRRLLVQRLFSILQFCLVWVLFVHSLMYFSLSWISQDWIWDALIIILNILVHSGCTAVNILWPTPMPLQ